MGEYLHSAVSYVKNFYRSQDLSAGVLLKPTCMVYNFFENKIEQSTAFRKWSWMALHLTIGGCVYILTSPLIVVSTCIRLISAINLIVSNKQQFDNLATVLADHLRQPPAIVCYTRVAKSAEFDDASMMSRPAYVLPVNDKQASRKAIGEIENAIVKIVDSFRKIHYRVNFLRIPQEGDEIKVWIG